MPIELGFALGLFAVFGILRYRTEPIRIRELTYMFVVIGIAIVNAVSNKKVSAAELFLVNTVIVTATLLLEYAPFTGQEGSCVVVYDNLALLCGNDKEALYEDLRKRTGQDIRRVLIRRLDLLRDTAELDLIFERKRDV